MAWSTVTSQGVRDRFLVLSPDKLPSLDTAALALADGEGYVKDRLIAIGFSPSDDTSKMLVSTAAAAFCYRYAWGIRAFGASEAAEAARQLFEWIDAFLKMMLDEGITPGSVVGSSFATNAGDTSPVFSLGDPTTWPMPTNEKKTEPIERRRF